LVLRPCQNVIRRRGSSKFIEETQSLRDQDSFDSPMVCNLAGRVSVPKDAVAHIPVFVTRFSFLIKTLSVV